MNIAEARTKICTKCEMELPKTTEYFGRSSKSSSGLYFWCKNCVSLYNKDRRYLRKKELEIQGPIDTTTKMCAQCQELLPRNTQYFCQVRKNSDGLNCYCKKCTHKQSVIYRNANKEKIQEKSKDYQAQPHVKHANKIKTRVWRKANKILCAYRMYKQHSKEDNREFSFSLYEFTSFVSQTCFYCGNPGDPYVGLDRVDNAVGYIDGNIVPCCKRCNYAKRNDSREDFLQLCLDVVNNLHLKD